MNQTNQAPQFPEEFDPADAFAVPGEEVPAPQSMPPMDAGADPFAPVPPAQEFGLAPPAQSMPPQAAPQHAAPQPAYQQSPAPQHVPQMPEPAPLPPISAAPSGGYGFDAAAVEELSDPNETLAPVPRITISAFCERPETAHLIERAAQDRRMSRAHVSVHMGGLSAAIEQYHDEATPNLILIESGMRGRVLFDQLDELANVCDEGSKVSVIGAANDIALYRELIRRGVSDYLVPPLSPMQVVRSVSGLFADPEQPFVGKVTAFIGAKGGVGSSTLAHNVAWQIAEQQRLDATIMDLDLSFGTAGLDFNQDTNQGIGEALSQPDRLDDVLLERLTTRCTDRLSLFTAPATLDRNWELDPQAYETVINEVRTTVPNVILDLPHTWSTWVKKTLFLADDVVIVASPDLACLRNAKNLYDLVKTSRSNDAPPRIIVNQVGVPKRPEISVKDFAEALGTEPALVLPFDPELFGQASNNGQMLSEVKGDSKVVAGLMSFTAGLTGRAEPAPVRKSLFSGLFKKG